MWGSPMYKRIIVAVGDYPEWDAPVENAIALAAYTEAELWLLRALAVPFVASAPDMVASSTLAMEQSLLANEHILGQAMLAAKQAGVSSHGLLRWGTVAEMLMQTAEEIDSDLLIVGAPSCPGWWRPLSGYLARKLLTQVSRPLLVVTSPPPVTYGAPLWPRLLTVHDGSVEAEQAVAYATRLADAEGLELCEAVVGRAWHALRSAAREAMEHTYQDNASPRAPEAALATNCRTVAVPHYDAAALLEVATTMQCDALVLKASHAGGWYRFRHTQVRNTLLKTSDLPLFLIPRGDHASA